MSQGKPGREGVILITILINTSLFGAVSQQFYGYSVGRLKDSLYLKLFVIILYVAIALQTILMCHFAYVRFVMINLLPPSSPPPDLWEGPVSSLCRLIIILLANMFLAARIYTLTKSRVQSGLVVSFSIIAYVIGTVAVVVTWKTKCGRLLETLLSTFWNATQAIAESLITLFLVQVLRNSRSGLRKSDTVVNYLVRVTIQTGCLATAWAIGALTTWFLLPGVLAFRFFDITSGAVYAYAIFDTLLSRAQLREQMASTVLGHELEWTRQDAPGRSSRLSSGPPARGSRSMLRVRTSVPPSSGTSLSNLGDTTKCDAIELQIVPESKLTSPLLYES